MKHVGLIAVALLLAAGPAATADKKDAGPVFTSPDWLRKPSPDAVMTAFPMNASASEGRGQIDCIVTVQGLLRDCKVSGEKPEGQGFGSAALAMAPQFLFKPATRDGRPIESSVTVPVNFSCDVSCRSITQGGQKILTGLNWAIAPTQEQMVAAYPPKARAQHILGVASIQCAVTAPGGLKGCQVMSEEPQGQGFGRAAISLAQRFEKPTNIGPDVKMNGALTRLTFTFGEQMFDGAPYVAKPRFAAAPTAKELMDAYRASAPTKEIVTGSATVRCRIVEAGGLTDCSLVSELPAGQGVGAAVLAVAPKFRLATWTEDGLPVIGTFVKLPIKFDIKDPPAVEPAKPPEAPK